MPRPGATPVVGTRVLTLVPPSSCQVIRPPPAAPAAGGPPPGEAGGAGLVRVVDGAVAEPLLDALRAGFAPAAPFWAAHGYGLPETGYFSYCYPLERAPRHVVEQYIASALRPQLARFFPALAAAGVVAEWWLHSRPHTAGHQLHYDTDEQVPCDCPAAPRSDSPRRGAARGGAGGGG